MLVRKSFQMKNAQTKEIIWYEVLDLWMFSVFQAPVSVPQSAPVEQPAGSTALVPPPVER